jgi:hypothetical protein
LLTLLFSFALEYAMTRVQENLVELKLKEIRQLLFYDDDEYLLGDNINVIKKNKEYFIDASEQAGLEVNAEKSKYM